MRKVTAPDGREWKVGRRWLPWKPRFRGTDGPDIGDALAFDDLAGLAVLAFVVLLTLAILLLLPVVVLAVEVLLLLILAIAGLFSRVVLGHPWIVTAIHKGPPPIENEWPVKGFRNSGEKVEEVAAALERGPTISGEAKG